MSDSKRTKKKERQAGGEFRAQSLQATQADALEMGESERTGKEGEGNTLARYVTNRGNLIEILSSGLIKPPATFGKYYPDGNAGCPNGVVVYWQDPEWNGMGETVEGAAAGMFPVLLDVDVNGLTEAARIEMAGGGDATAKDFVTVLDGVLPASRIRAIHFRSEEERTEFRGRVYGNLREDTTLDRVSPERFAGPPIDQVRLENAVAGAGANVETNRVRETEAAGGIFLLWGTLRERYATPVRTEAAEKPSAEAQWGERVFGMCLDEATALTPETFYHADMLDEVRRRLEEEMAEAGGDRENGQEYLKWMETMAGVLDNTTDIDAFPPDAPEPLNGLLYFLLHSEPETVMEGWKDERETVPVWLEDAAAWCGALHKHARIPITQRPIQVTEREIAEWEAGQINGTREREGTKALLTQSALRETLAQILDRAEEATMKAEATKQAAESELQEKSKRSGGAKRAGASKTKPARASGGTGTGGMTRGILFGNLKGVPIKAEATRFGGPGLDTDAGNENLAKIVMPFACTAQNFHVRILTAQPVSGGLALTIRRNGTNTGITITVTPGATPGVYAETAKRAQYEAGDEFSIRLENHAKSQSAGIGGWSVEYEVK